MADFELDIPMPDSYKNIFMEIVKRCREQKTLSFHVRPEVRHDVCYIVIGKIEPYPIPKNPTGSMFAPFRFSGLVDIPAEENIVMDGGQTLTQFTCYLTPKGIHWYEYQKLPPWRQFFARHSVMEWVKNIALIIAFFLSVWLTYLQIVEQLSKH